MAVGVVEETFWHRLYWAARRPFATLRRDATPREMSLDRRLEEARSESARLRAELAESATQREMLESSLRVSALEIANLTLVVERDRMRVEADMAAFARKIAESQSNI